VKIRCGPAAVYEESFSNLNFKDIPLRLNTWEGEKDDDPLARRPA